MCTEEEKSNIAKKLREYEGCNLLGLYSIVLGDGEKRNTYRLYQELADLISPKGTEAAPKPRKTCGCCAYYNEFQGEDYGTCYSTFVYSNTSLPDFFVSFNSKACHGFKSRA